MAYQKLSADEKALRKRQYMASVRAAMTAADKANKRAYMVEYAEANRERLRRQKRAYYAANRHTFIAKAKAWRSANPDCVRVAKYGISPEQFVALVATQDGACAICRRVPATQRRAHIDHDRACCAGLRSCGKCVRGLLCSHCNVMLGMARDTPSILRAAADYIEKHHHSRVTD